MKEMRGARKTQGRTSELLGRRVLRLRTRRRMSRAELAQALCVSTACLAKWESGIREPGLDALIELGELLEVSLDLLIAGKAPGVLPPEEQEKLDRRVEALRQWLL